MGSSEYYRNYASGQIVDFNSSEDASRRLRSLQPNRLVMHPGQRVTMGVTSQRLITYNVTYVTQSQLRIACAYELGLVA